MIDRMKLIQEAQERKLRELIRTKIKLLKEKSGPKSKGFTPHKSTGINVLEDVLKKIIPVLEQQYKSLTSNRNQRRSYRLHILNAVKNMLLPEQALFDSDQSQINESVNLKFNDQGENSSGPVSDPSPKQETEKYMDPEKLIKIDDRFEPPKKTKEDEENDFINKHTIKNTDLTGRNFALISIRQIQQPIIESYETLSSQEDKDTFFEYLLTNLKLYFDKFEDELGLNNISEPSSPDYNSNPSTSL